MNSINVPADETEEAIVAGKPVREWFVGANFFPHYGLDHHGYFNVGYMVICLSNAAMLHFDMRAQGLPLPESLYHHNADLWQVVRQMTFSDGRLARIGGDSRVRYAYCQEYLLPSIVYAADQLGEVHAAHLLRAQCDLIHREAAYNGDGSFYGKRLSYLIERSPYYYTRLESDRACAIGMALRYAQQVAGGKLPALHQPRPLEVTAPEFEATVAGSWWEPEHGAVLHRSPTRLASYSWRAHGLTQGLCQPPDDGDLAEWSQNLSGVVRMQGDDGTIRGGQSEHRRLEGFKIVTFAGGFATAGAVEEGYKVEVPEGCAAVTSRRCIRLSMWRCPTTRRW